jgi:type II secretory pathway pseudopilin PulG
MMSDCRHRAADGFTLVETLGVVVLIGLLAAMAGMAVSGLYRAGQDKQAIAAAQAINQAEQIYLVRVSGAATAWSQAGNSPGNSGAGSNDIKFSLISAYLPGTPSSLETYEPNGYTFTLGSSLTSPVAIEGPNGSVSY